MSERFKEPFLALAAAGHRELLSDLSSSALVGGTIYDALARTAKAYRVTLVSLDRRASAVYEVLGVEIEQLAP